MSTRPQPEAGSALDQGFRIGELRVDPPAGELSGAGGTRKLDPKVMAVLLHMAKHAGQVVTRDDLLTSLWSGVVVGDDALTRCFYELRRELSLAGGSDEFKALIETLPKRGYRLNGEVMPLAPRDAAPPASSRAKRWIAAALIAALAAIVGYRAFYAPSQTSNPTVATQYAIAVLPFDDLSADQDQAHFSDGVSEEIINRLSQTRGLRVISRRSSFSFRGEAISIPEIARQLNVTHVLEGSVRKSGNRVRMTARLVEAASGAQVWSENYDLEQNDLFAVQDRVADAVAKALDATLAAHHEHVPNVDAHNLFLQGELFYNRRAPGDIDRAVRYYQDALKSDPSYARAWASLAGAYSLLAYEGGMPRPEALAKQADAARRAIDLDPNLAVGYARLSQYFWDIGDRPAAYRTFERALALDPDDVLVLTFAAGISMRKGEIAEAIARYDRIVALDPRSAAAHANRGVYLQAADRFEEAKKELASASALNPDLGEEFDLATVRIFVFQKRIEDAGKLADRLPEGRIRDHALALLFHAEGRKAEADAALARLVAESSTPVDVRLAEVYAYRGMTEKAFQALQGVADAVRRNERAEASQLWSWQVEMRVSPFLRPLHDDPRWQQLMVEPLAVNS